MITKIDVNQEQQRAKERVSSMGTRVLVCTGTGCVANGSFEVVEKFKELGCIVENSNCGHKYTTVNTGCQGFCDQGVLVDIPDLNITYIKVKPADVEEIVESHLKNGKVVERLIYVNPQTQQRAMNKDGIDYYSKQTKILLDSCGKINPEELDESLASGGYQALNKALSQMTRDDVINEMIESGLRGRGGGGFPTGRKWAFVKAAVGDKKYIICNGDEGDPGAFMDGSVMEGDPHRLLEGMAIAAYAVGADEGYLYVRAEYPLSIKRLKIAIAQAEERGYLGSNILGSDFSCKLHIKEGAGAFVCGEETALIASIEGERGMPKAKPPFPANKGLFGKPTLINNVETFANIPGIIDKGAKWFKSYGIETSTGTKTFALTGEVNNTGLIEVPFGTSLRTIIFDIGGGIRNGKKFKAVQIGGPSGGCLTEEHLDTLSLDYDSLRKAGAMVGSGGLVVTNEDTCIVELARFFMSKCVPCREGTKNMLAILEKIVAGKATMKDIDLLEELALAVQDGSLCGLGKTAPNPVLSTLKYFKKEYEAHILEKRCPAGVCKAFKTIEIDPVLCKGCSKCARQCPVEAIEGKIKETYKIDQDKCIKCGACLTACPFNAIKEV
ncbi:MAG: NADH-quinone oxidoreductase subunit NuoF [Candidatus Gastranaerophilaceae bacterium]|jgi:NADH-quinone oxidoreductase subunit F